eukprot:7401646-Alexandrium_andersonii.AAC.1
MPAGPDTAPGGRESGKTGSDRAARKTRCAARRSRDRSKELPRASAACFSVSPPGVRSSAT